MSRSEQYARWRARHPDVRKAIDARYKARNRDRLAAERRERERLATAMRLLAQARRIADEHVRPDVEPWDNGLHGDCVGIATEALLRWRYQPLAFRMAKAHRLVKAFLRKRARERWRTVSLDALDEDGRSLLERLAG